MGGEVDSRSASDAALPAIAPIGGGTSVAVGTSKPRLLQILGPGLITGASDDDPSGIGTYSQAGAQLGFGITWTMLFTYPLMAAIQEISARVGRVTGRGLAGNICRHYPGWMLQTIVFSLFAANAINIGADLGAMGDATKLLIGGSATGFVLHVRGGLRYRPGLRAIRPLCACTQMAEPEPLRLCRGAGGGAGALG